MFLFNHKCSTINHYKCFSQTQSRKADKTFFKKILNKGQTFMFHKQPFFIVYKQNKTNVLCEIQAFQYKVNNIKISCYFLLVNAAYLMRERINKMQ